MASLHVVTPGLQTTIQDRGRWGWQSRGVPVAGPMDLWSHRAANALVGNSPDAAILEVTLIGPDVEFDAERMMAVTGALFELTLDGASVPMNAPIVVPAGSRLRFGRRLRGTRAYLAICGGIVVPATLGSRSTHVGSRMGGLDGRALKAGDRLPLEPHKRGRESFSGGAASTKKTPEPFSVPDRMATVRVMAGPHHERFVADALDALQSAPYVIGHNSDRMGFRLEGATLLQAGGLDGLSDFISDATPLGSIQGPASAPPILLMADHQTTGGYPTLATVITADIGLAGQLGPGDSIAFVVCSHREAMAALVDRERVLMAIEAETSA